MALIEKQKATIDRIAAHATSWPGEVENADPPASERWIALLEMQRERIGQLDDEEAKLRFDRSILNDQIAALKRELQSIRNEDEQREGTIAEIDLAVAQPGDLTLRLVSVVKAVRWRPVYDVVADGETRDMRLRYRAEVRQATGEDWEDIQLTLSTAPLSQAEEGELRPWYVSRAEPRNRGFTGALSAPAPPELNGDAAYDLGYAANQALAEETAVGRPPTRPEMASTRLAATFTVSGRTAVAGDNSAHGVQLTEIPLSGEVYYIAVPELTEDVLLKATVRNESDVPILAGEAFVYLDVGEDPAT